MVWRDRWREGCRESALWKGLAGGKLPFTWPRNVGQIPIFYAHNSTHSPGTQGKRYWNEESTPLFPFGFGLSYSHFEFSNLQVMSPQVQSGQNIELTVDVANAGNTAADEVVQLYLHQQHGQASRPVRELQGVRESFLSLARKEDSEIYRHPAKPFLLEQCRS